MLQGSVSRPWAKSRYPIQIAPEIVALNCLNGLKRSSEALSHHRHHMASKESSSPLSFWPPSRGAAFNKVVCQPATTAPRLGLSDDRQLFVAQLDAQAPSVRTLE
jgi:hypothetical protein